MGGEQTELWPGRARESLRARGTKRAEGRKNRTRAERCLLSSSYYLLDSLAPALNQIESDQFASSSARKCAVAYSCASGLTQANGRGRLLAVARRRRMGKHFIRPDTSWTGGGGGRGDFGLARILFNSMSSARTMG